MKKPQKTSDFTLVSCGAAAPSLATILCPNPIEDCPVECLFGGTFIRNFESRCYRQRPSTGNKLVFIGSEGLADKVEDWALAQHHEQRVVVPPRLPEEDRTRPVA